MNLQSLDDFDLQIEQTTYDEDYDNDFDEQQNMVGELLDRVHHVKKLTLGNYCIQVGFSWHLSLYICIQIH